MFRPGRFAVLAAVAVGSVLMVSCADHSPPPVTELHLSQETDQLVDSSPITDIPSDTLNTLDAVRKAELNRRARRPDGDPERKHTLNYDGVLKGSDFEGKGPNPKPAAAMPATACRSVEPVTKRDDPFTGPHRLHDLTVHLFETESGFGMWRMLLSTNRRGVLVSSKAVDRVELVSLLTAPQPTVYVLDEMATPVLARQAKRRPLDEFETRSLEAVRKGEELVWTREAPNRMFGAIRAGKDCLDCHSKAKEGDLLGAFTYYLEVPVDQIGR